MYLYEHLYEHPYEYLYEHLYEHLYDLLYEHLLCGPAAHRQRLIALAMCWSCLVAGIRKYVPKGVSAKMFVKVFAETFVRRNRCSQRGARNDVQ